MSGERRSLECELCGELVWRLRVCVPATGAEMVVWWSWRGWGRVDEGEEVFGSGGGGMS